MRLFCFILLVFYTLSFRAAKIVNLKDCVVMHHYNTTDSLSYTKIIIDNSTYVFIDDAYSTLDEMKMYKIECPVMSKLNSIFEPDTHFLNHFFFEHDFTWNLNFCPYHFYNGCCEVVGDIYQCVDFPKEMIFSYIFSGQVIFFDDNKVGLLECFYVDRLPEQKRRLYKLTASVTRKIYLSE